MELSVVLPVYGCRDCLDELYERLRAALEPLTAAFELIFVDDRSPDGAWDALKEVARRDPRVHALRLSRNFGEHAAVTAGLGAATGRWVLILDCDLQDAPEDVPRLYAKAQEGYDVVLTRRTERGQPWARRLASRAYFRLLNFLLKTRLDPDGGTMTLMSRKVVEALLAMREKEYRLALEWLGFERATVDVERRPRPVGRSSYSFGGLFRVAWDGLFFQSTALLRWIVLLGFLVAAAGTALALYFVISYLVHGESVRGWTSISVLLLLLSGFIIMSVGIAALYVGRIFDHVKERPLYVIDERHHASDERSPTAPEPRAERLPH